MTRGLSSTDERISVRARRRAIRLASANAGLWAVGNGLASSTLVFYLAVDRGAQGIAISFILAAPRFAGVLRVVTPAMVAWLGNRKAFCVSTLLVRSVALCFVPLAASPQIGSASGAITALVVSWCVYHLLEYVGVVALWSWLGDLTPRPIRGRLLGQIERWLTMGRIAGIAISVALALGWSWWLPDVPRLVPLLVSAAVGTVLIGLSVLPLVMMPGLEGTPSARPRAPWQSLVEVFTSGAYRRLLVFQCWFGVANGFTAAAQEYFPRMVLGVPYVELQGMRAGMRAGQSALAPRVGRLVDRWGNRPVMIVSQLLVATGPLFFFFATPEWRWLIGGAFLVWIAYVGLNVGLDNVKLKLAPADNNAPYLAVYYAVGDLANGIAIIAGGVFMEWIIGADAEHAMTIYGGLFLAGWFARTSVVPLVAWLEEPGARPVGEMLHDVKAT